VEAHRALQDLLEEDFRGHESVEVYRDFLSDHPDWPEAWILLGRIHPDPDEQARHFRKALQLDPDGYWPNLAMGFALLMDRSAGAARTFFRKALDARPRDGRTWRFLAEASAAGRDFKTALAALRKAALFDPGEVSHPLRSAQILLSLGKRKAARGLLFRIFEIEKKPTLPPRVLLRKILRDERSPELLRQVWAQEQRRLARFPKAPAVLAFAGYLALRLHRMETAERLLGKALAKMAPPSRVILDLRLVRFALGKYLEGIEIWKQKVPPAQWEREGNEARPRFRKMIQAAERAQASPRDPQVLTRLGDALRACGWVNESLVVLDRAAGLGAAGAGSMGRQVRAHLEFVRRLRLFLTGAYSRFLEKDDAGDLPSLFTGISAISLEVLGEDLGKGNPLQSFFLVGEVLDHTRTESSPLLRYFETFNQYLILGRRRGGTPEAVLMTVVFRDRHHTSSHLGASVRCDFAAGEDFVLGSFGEFLGGALLGVALMGRFYANLDEAADRDYASWYAVLKSRKKKAKLRRFGSWEARERKEAVALDTGKGLGSRLLLAAFRDVPDPEAIGLPPPPEVRMAEKGIIDHELMHVRDAQRYLPVWRHPTAALGLGLRHGFSKTSIEASMEERAALAALCLSDRPHVDLAALLSFAPYPEHRLPHSRGYCRLLTKFLRTLYDHPEAFPSVDRRKNLCRQLHRLTAAEIHRAARFLAEGEGLLGRD
jgi:tetratricopeptide (TPR) repeat protein